MMNDLLADTLIRIKNAGMRGLDKTIVLKNKLISEVLLKLKSEGYIEDIENLDNNREIKIKLKYYRNQPVIKYIRKVSKGSRRIYSGSKDMLRSKFTYGLFILSTNQGIKTNIEARKLNIGGEVLMEIF